MMRQLPGKTLRQRLPGIIVVVLLHIGIGYLLFNGLARKVVEKVIEQPLVVSLIETPKPAPAPPAPPKPQPEPPKPEPKPEPPKPEPKPQPPKPEPKPQPPKPKPKPKPRPQQPAPPPVSPAAPAETTQPVSAPARVAAPTAPAAAVTSIAVVCSNHASVRSSVPYPSMAKRRNEQGSVVAEFTVSPRGQVENVRIVSSSNAVFDDAVLEAVQRFRCSGQNAPVRIRVPFEFSLR